MSRGKGVLSRSARRLADDGKRVGAPTVADMQCLSFANCKGVGWEGGNGRGRGGAADVADSFFDLFLSLPASFNALLINHSNCPFVLRNSSAAHFSTAPNKSGSSRSTNGFFLGISFSV